MTTATPTKRRQVCAPRPWAEIPEGAWVTVYEAAERLRESETSVRRRVDRGGWKHTRVLLPPAGAVQRAKRLICKRCVDSPSGDCGAGA